MKFEWNPRKSSANKKKHGVSFEEAMNIWKDVHIDVKNIAKSESEFRSATLGIINGKIYVAIWTKRNSTLRLITVRKARKNEEKIFKENL